MAVTVQQEVAALYSAIFNRAPDQAGLEFWVNAIEGGDSLVQAAEGFTQHPVFAETYAGMSDSQFVQQLYVNILGGAGDANGIAFWTEKLASGVSKGQVVAEFVQGALSIDLDALLASGELSQAEYDAAVVRQDSLTNKANVGLHFVEKFGAATNLSADTDTTTKEGLESDPVYLASQAAIANVTADAASVTAAKAAIDAAEAPTDLNVAPAFTLTEGLEVLQAAQANAAEALEAVAVAVNANAVTPLEDDPEDENDAYDQFVAGFTAKNATDAAAAAVQAIEDAQADIDGANAALLTARAVTFSNHGADDEGDVLVAAKIVTASTVMTDANVAKAVAAAQAAVVADKAVYNDAGAVVVDADGEVQAGYTKVYQLADKSFTSDAEAEGATFVGYAVANEAVAVDESDLVLGGDVNGEAGDDAVPVEATPATIAIGINSAYNGTLNVGGVNVTITNGVATANDLQNIATLAGVDTVTQADGVITITGTVSDENDDNNAETAADLTALEAGITFVGTGAADTTYETAEVFKGVSASALQALLAEAEGDLTADEVTNGSAAELLADLRAAINAYAAAEGDVDLPVAEGVGGDTLADVRKDIADILDAEELDAEDAEALVATIAGYAQEADVAGKDFGIFAPNLTDKTTDAQEAAIISAFEAIAARQELVKAVGTAENHFTASAGAVLAAAETLQAERDKDIQTVADAETAKAEAEEYAASIADLVAAYELAAEGVADAEAALEEAGVESLISLTENTTGTLFGADLFVYSAESGDITIGRFEAEDQLFLGTGYNLVTLTADDNLTTDRLGDATAMEVFAQQVGGNVVLYVEQQTFAGNDTGAIADSDFETITLTGATLEDLAFSNGALVFAG